LYRRSARRVRSKGGALNGKAAGDYVAPAILKLHIKTRMSWGSEVCTLGIFIHAGLHRNPKLVCAKKKQNERIVWSTCGCAKNKQ
jgi:hypothetical protein